MPHLPRLSQPCLLALSLGGCGPDKGAHDSGGDTEDGEIVEDSGDSGDSADSADSGDSGGSTEPAERWEGAITLDETASNTWLGQTAGDRLGRTVMAAGDWDGDGYDDMALGAYYWSDDTLRKGRAWVFSGPVAPGDSDLDAAALIVTGETETEFVSRSLAGGSDIDGDGLDDLLVGSPNWNGGRGRSCLHLGGVTGSVLQSDATACVQGTTGLFGAFGTLPGDLDGDGLDDALVSTIFGTTGGPNGGEITLLPGPMVAGVTAAEDAPSLLFGAEGDEAGWFTCTAGDANGDGYGDLVIGAPGADGEEPDAGRVWLLLGPLPDGVVALADAAAASFLGQKTGAQTGRAVAGGEDLDGDGRDDLLVGARHDDLGGDDAGGMALLLGPVEVDAMGDAAMTWAGDSAGDDAGSSVRSAGDVDGDGSVDVMFGGPGDADGGADAGAVWLVYGPALAGDVGFKVSGEVAGGALGMRAGAAADLSGDGLFDLLLGAPKASSALSKSGSILFVTGF